MRYASIHLSTLALHLKWLPLTTPYKWSLGAGQYLSDSLGHLMLDFTYLKSPVTAFLHCVEIKIIAHYLSYLFEGMYSSGGEGRGSVVFLGTYPRPAGPLCALSGLCLKQICTAEGSGAHSTGSFPSHFWYACCHYRGAHMQSGVCAGKKRWATTGVNVWATISGPPSCAFSTLLAQSFCSSIWGWCSSLLVYFKEPTCSAQTSSLGEWREPVTAARAVLAVVICMPFSPLHFLQLSACFPREIEKGQLHFSPERKLLLGVKWQEAWNHSLCRGLKATSRCPLCVNQFPAPARHRRWQRPGPALRLARHERRLGTSEVERVTWWAQ